MCRRRTSNLHLYLVIFFFAQASQISLDPRTIIAICRKTFRIFTERVKECHIRAGISFATFSTITKHKWDITYLAEQFSALPSIVNLNNFFSSGLVKAASNKRNFSATFSRSRQMSLCNSLSWTMLVPRPPRAKWRGENESMIFNSRHMTNVYFENVKITMQFPAASTPSGMTQKSCFLSLCSGECVMRWHKHKAHPFIGRLKTNKN